MIVRLTTAATGRIDADNIDAARLGWLPNSEHDIVFVFGICNLLNSARQKLLVENVFVALIRSTGGQALTDFESALRWEEVRTGRNEALDLGPRIMPQHIFLGSVLAFTSPPGDLLRSDGDVVLGFDIARPLHFLIGECAVPIGAVVRI